MELASAQQELLSAQDARDQLNRDLPERQTQALQALTDAKDALRKADIKYQNINSPASTADLNEARANYSVTKNRLEKAQEDFDPYEKRSDTNLQRAYYLSRLADAQRKFEAAEKNLNKLLGCTSGFFESQSEAELKIAHAQYLDGNYAESIVTLTDFQRRHPTSPQHPIGTRHAAARDRNSDAATGW